MAPERSDRPTTLRVTGFPFLTSVTHPSSPGKTQSVALSYDGAIHTATQWSGEVSGLVTETWDSTLESLSRTTSVAGSSISVTNHFDADGLPLGSNYLSVERDPVTRLVRREATPSTPGKARVISQFTFNEFREQTGKVVTLIPPAGGSGSVVYSEQLTRDRLGRITRSVQTIQGTPYDHLYTYDSAGRILSETVNGIRLGSWTYDPNGNATTFFIVGDDQVTAYEFTATYDEQDRLLQATQTGTTHSFSVHYSPNGEAIDTGNGPQRFGYDSNGALIHVETDHGTVVDYVLDGLGRRVGRKVNGSAPRSSKYPKDRAEASSPATAVDSAGRLQMHWPPRQTCGRR